MYSSEEKFRIKFWGTRGSVPVPGAGTLIYGGNTSCVEVRCGDELIIVDAGTGIRELGTQLLKKMPVKASILFSHMHWDHIQGIPFFRPAYIPGNEFKLYGNRSWDAKLESVLRWQMRKPNFPVALEEVTEVGARMEYVDIEAGAVFHIGDKGQITIRSIEVRHPDKAFAFRIDYGGRSLVYASDTESLTDPDSKLVMLASGTDVLIHDAQYTSDEYNGFDGNSRDNWGHSTPEMAASVALAARVNKLILFHHDPYHDDAKIDQMVEAASTIFPNTVAASEGAIADLLVTTVSGESYPEEIDMLPVYCSTSAAS